MSRAIFLIVLTWIPVLGFSQSLADSLERMYRESSHDTLKLYYLDELVWDKMNYDLQDARRLALQEVELSLKTDHLRSIANANHSLGTVYLSLAEFDSALFFFKRAVGANRKLGAKDRTASNLNGIANVYLSKGMYESALKYYLEALDHALPDNYMKQSLITGNVGATYQKLRNFEKGIEYLSKSIELARQAGDSIGVAAGLNNVGNCYLGQQRYNEARPYFLKAKLINESYGQVYRLAENFNNLSIVEKNTGNLSQAINYCQEAIRLNEETGNTESNIAAINNLASIYMKMGENRKAEELLHKGMSLAREHGVLEPLLHIYGQLNQLYAAENRFKEAHAYLVSYADLQDSLFNLENTKQIAEMQTKYDTEKKESAIALLEKENALREARIFQQDIQRNLLLSGLGVLLVFGVFVTRGYRQKRRHNKLLTERKQIIEKANLSLQEANEQILSQKSLIELRNRDITDSITYARRIQSAILAPEKDIRQVFPQSFLLWLPKDIVSGDFYYFTTANGYHYYAVADCTGHGVPGALVSLICSASLDKAIKESALVDPAKILDAVRALVIEYFRKSGEQIQDGMDISLCVVREDKKQLLWAGANNPLWMIHNGMLTEFKGDKQPVGLMAAMKPFITHEIPLENGATYYMSSDGFADQFGGPSGKKLKTASFKRFLLENADRDMHHQQDELRKWFLNWRGELEQVDDVTVVGFRV